MTSAIVRGSPSVEYTTRHVPSPRSITSIVPRWWSNIGVRDPVLEAALDVVVHEDLLGHRHAGAEVIDARVARRPARGDAGEPLVQPGRVAGELPDVVGRAMDAHLVANRAECHGVT